MHQVPGYSPGPGVSHVSSAAGYIGQPTSIIDFGCGTGDAAQAFISLGHDVFAVDISRNGLRYDFGDRFIKSSLHELSDAVPGAEWGFCCDVMEHLPTEWVPVALGKMAGKVINCYFSISGVPDSWGPRIGETLHLTIKPAAWWLAVIGVHFRDVRLLHDSGPVYEILAIGATRGN